MINVSNASLELSRRLSDVTNKAWEDGTMLQQVTPITKDLLNYWFGDARCEAIDQGHLFLDVPPSGSQRFPH